MRYQDGFRRSLEEHPVSGGRVIRVHRIHRADLYFDHWQKSASARASLAFRDILREERPDLVHVHHWIRLSRDLVHRAALERIPAVVTLHDLWTSCLVTFRVRPESGEFCEARLAPSPCIRCAAQLPPRTPWLSFEAQGIALLERSVDLVRELELARAVLAPTGAHAAALTRFLGVPSGRLAIRVMAHGRDLALAPSAARPPWPARRLVLGAWGHLHRLKGADRIVRALARLADPSRVELHLAGSEPDPRFADELRALSTKLDVRFHGAYDATALGAHPVSAVHAFVSGTLAHESWGLVLDEAVALGLPMILPRSGAYAERLQEGAGVLFYDPGSEASLAGVLERVLADPALLTGVAARLPDPRVFTPSVAEQVARHLELYAEVAAGPRPEARAVPERERIWQASEDAWGRELSKRRPEELGFP
jgi:glycosyltransferase involved in cell wall biosynthesis